MSNNPGAWTVEEILQATGGRLVSGQEKTQCRGVSTDSRTIRAGDLFVAIAGETYDGHSFLQHAIARGAEGVLVGEAYVRDSSSISLAKGLWIAVPDTLRALGDLAAFRRRRSRLSVVAITGTNGKTTTKEMTAEVLSRSFTVLRTPGNFNNLVGLPLTLLGLDDRHEWAVLEIAMNHPGEIRRLAEIADPDIGVITNIEAGHLEGVKDINGVMEAKGELLDVLGRDRVAVLNADDERVCKLAERFSGRVVTFGIQSSAEVWGTPGSQTRAGSSFDLSWYDQTVRVSLKISGRGAIYNALAAAAVGYRVGLSIEDVKKGLEGTVPLPDRMEITTLSGGIHLINDTYNANPGSVAAAIETLQTLKSQARGIVVLGDMLELGEHAQRAHKQIGVMAARAGMSGLYATGDFAAAVAEGAVGAGMAPGKVCTGTKAQIVEILKDRLAPGDWVLVKGSHRMAMDQVVDKLRSELGSVPKQEKKIA